VGRRLWARDLPARLCTSLYVNGGGRPSQATEGLVSQLHLDARISAVHAIADVPVSESERRTSLRARLLMPFGPIKAASAPR
jgi:hypothetical protein